MQERGTLLCSGHNGSYLGFVEVNDRNEWSGLDIDLCRALTVAIPGDPDKNQIVQLSWAQRFPALLSGDVVIKATGRTTGRDTELGLQFSIPYVFGGAQLMVRKELGTTSASDLGVGTVCVAAGTTIERIVADHLKAKNVERTMVSFEKTAEVIGAYRPDAATPTRPGVGPSPSRWQTSSRTPMRMSCSATSFRPRPPRPRCARATKTGSTS